MGLIHSWTVNMMQPWWVTHQGCIHGSFMHHDNKAHSILKQYPAPKAPDTLYNPNFGHNIQDKIKFTPACLTISAKCKNSNFCRLSGRKPEKACDKLLNRPQVFFMLQTMWTHSWCCDVISSYYPASNTPGPSGPGRVYIENDPESWIIFHWGVWDEFELSFDYVIWFYHNKGSF